MAGHRVTEYSAYTNLGAAVVCKAAEDYKNYIKSPHPNAITVERGVDAEKFLRSSYCDLFTSIDGNYICNKLKKETKKSNYNPKRRTNSHVRKKSETAVHN